MVLTKDPTTFHGHQNRGSFKRWLLYKGCRFQDLDDILQEFYLRCERYNILKRAYSYSFILNVLTDTLRHFYEERRRREAQDNRCGQGLELFANGQYYGDTAAVTDNHLALRDFRAWYSEQNPTNGCDMATFDQTCHAVAYCDPDPGRTNYNRIFAWARRYRKFLSMA